MISCTHIAWHAGPTDFKPTAQAMPVKVGVATNNSTERAPGKAPIGTVFDIQYDIRTTDDPPAEGLDEERSRGSPASLQT